MKTWMYLLFVFNVLNPLGQLSFAQSDELQAPPEVSKRSSKSTIEKNQNADNDSSVSSGKQVRLFQDVLDELLTEFGYDVKAGKLGMLRNLSIRKVSVSESLPRSYQSYIELLVSERIKDNSKLKLISCLPCKTKSTRVVDEQLMVSSANTNVEELSRAAAQLGIENFMDVVLVYHSTHMIIAFEVFDTNSKELVWTKTYNSEALKTRYQKMAIDYSQIEKSRTSDDYVPDYRYLIGIGGGSIPNVSSSARERSVLALQIRGTEKFDNRHNEFGLLLNFYQATSALLSEYPTEGTATSSSESASGNSSSTVKATPFKTSIALYGIYAKNFLGAVESYDQMRQGFHTGLGISLATGYFAPCARLGWDVYLGRRFAVNTAAFYVASANILLKGKFTKISGGPGADLAISYNL